MARITSANLLICRVARIATLLAHSGHANAIKAPEQAFSAPKATKPEINGLIALRVGPKQWTSIYKMRRQFK
jgi:hypothetical protein